MLRIHTNRNNLARSLRRKSTLPERLLWGKLRANRFCGLSFKRQEPIGKYIVDFVCHQAKIIIEADGSQHNDNPKDAERTTWLEKQGYRVLRFWNNDIQYRMDGVLETILDAVRDLVPQTPPPACLTEQRCCSEQASSPAKAGEGNTSRLNLPTNT